MRGQDAHFYEILAIEGVSALELLDRLHQYFPLTYLTLCLLPIRQQILHLKPSSLLTTTAELHLFTHNKLSF